MTSNVDENQPVILSAVRSPMGRFQGALSALSATELGAAVVREAVRRSGLEAPDEIDEVLMGNVVSSGLGQAPARQAAIGAGLPPSVGATTLNKVCGSGLKACMIGAQAIKAGDAKLIVAGGMESMSNTPHLVSGRRGLKYGDNKLVDALLHDGLWDPFENWSMGLAAEWIADEFEVTREAMDRLAFQSHQRALDAMDSGAFEEEILPLDVPLPKNGTHSVAVDEGPRRDTSFEKMSALKPAFKQDGRVTAANAPGLNDGAAALVLANRAWAAANGLLPMARIVGYAQAAVPPKEMFTAPALAVPRLLEKTGWSLEDVDLIELNEAFAAQALANGYALADQGWNWDKVNVHGGAIALGHPLGATGARILTTLLFAMRQRGARRGLATLCLGGGEAVALAVEMD